MLSSLVYNAWQPGIKDASPGHHDNGEAEFACIVVYMIERTSRIAVNLVVPVV